MIHKVETFTVTWNDRTKDITLGESKGCQCQCMCYGVVGKALSYRDAMTVGQAAIAHICMDRKNSIVSIG